VTRNLAFVLILATISLGSAPAQRSSFAASHASYLLRVERVRMEDGVCAMVRGDGQYHFERDLGDRTDVYEGALGGEELQTLFRFVDQDDLLYLSQREIPVPPVINGLDRVNLAILRPGHWQILEFYGGQGSKPYASYLDPLLEWLDRLRKEKHLKLREEAGRNNCLPEEKIELKIRPPNNTVQPNGVASDGASQAAHPETSFLLLMTRSILNSSQSEKTCLIVNQERGYHLERKRQRLGDAALRNEIYEGPLSSTELQHLQQILNDPELQARKEDDDPPSGALQELELTHLTIPRGATLQRISLWRYVRAFVAGTAAVNDNGVKLLEPLNQWRATNLDEKKLNPVSGDKSLPVCANPGP
jgi:hypothetical protein